MAELCDVPHDSRATKNCVLMSSTNPISWELVKNAKSGGAWMVQSVERASLDLGMWV